ncbi:MAG: ATP-binding cassette domain-containing protein, partial [Gammaproteobacteria bacterium]
LFEQLNLNPLLKAQMLDLSGGELQRVLIAQAILQKPQLLVLDEPLQGVDFMGQNIFYDLIQSLKETYQLSILLVSHDIHLIMAKTDQVLCLNQHICCMGSPDKIQNNPEFLNLFGLKDTANLGFYTHHHNHHHDW